jgi:2-C-methyl-D-erythritol 4-phosphate cytidylyltransferase
MAVQTPQAFVAPVLRAALDGASGELARATDCAALVEAAGGRIATVEGDERLLKVTTPADLERARGWL